MHHRHSEFDLDHQCSGDGAQLSKVTRTFFAGLSQSGCERLLHFIPRPFSILFPVIAHQSNPH